MIVLDSSAAADLLLRSRPQAAWVEAQLDAANWDLHAPYVLDIEVARTIRRFVLGGALTTERGAVTLELLAGLSLTRYPHVPLFARAWELRHVADVADACFVALAQLLGVPVVTTDERLARTPGLQVEIRSFAQ